MHFPFSLGKSTENVLKSQFWASVPKFLRFLTGNWMHFNVASNHIFQVGRVRAPPMASFLLISLLLYPITSSCQSSSHRTTNSLLPTYLSSTGSRSRSSLQPVYSSLQRSSQLSFKVHSKLPRGSYQLWKQPGLPFLFSLASNYLTAFHYNTKYAPWFSHQATSSSKASFRYFQLDTSSI